MSITDDIMVMVVGGGIAGLAVSKLLSDNGIPFALIEKTSNLGGHSRNWPCMATTHCVSCNSCCVFEYEENVASSNVGHIYLDHEFCGFKSFPTNPHLARIRNTKSGEEIEMEVFAVVLALGFDIYDPLEKSFWGYGRIDGVMTLAELNRMMRLGQMDSLLPTGGDSIQVAFFQCVGSRDKSIGSNYCSQYCCGAALRTSMKLAYEWPGFNLTVFYIDLQLPGKTLPSLMAEAKAAGIRFLQGVPGEIWQTEEGRLRVFSEIDGRNVVEDFDRIVLSVGQRPPLAASYISSCTGVPLNEFGFLKTRSLEDSSRSSVDGIYLAGSCLGPSNIEDSVISAGKVVSAIISDMNVEM